MSRSRERYARLRQSFWRHPVVGSLSDAAGFVYARSLSYAQDQLSDGFMTPDGAVMMVAGGTPTECLMTA